MSDIKLTIDGTEYELEPCFGALAGMTPTIYFNGCKYTGKAIAKQPKEDYTITAFRSTLHSGNNIILTRNKDNTFHSSYAQEFDLLNSSIHEIYSIQRHSDNEVFSIGDEFLGDNERLTIESFKVHNNTIRLWAKEEGGYFVLSEIQKVKPKVPLFKDELGNDIFYDIPIYYVAKHSFTLGECTFKTAPLDGFREYYLYFLNKKDAEDYIISNKHITISYKEIKDFQNNNRKGNMNPNLKDFFKSKINNQ